MKNTRLTKGVAAAALMLAGLGAGTAVIGAASANAATSDTTSITAPASDSSAKNQKQTAPDLPQPVRSDEKLLTGDTATKVAEVTMAKYPGATIQRAETDSEGVYEAHIVTDAGDMVIVQVGADFTITGTQTGGGGGTGTPPAPPTDSWGNPLAPPAPASSTA
jgi:hypothetical protein